MARSLDGTDGMEEWSAAWMDGCRRVVLEEVSKEEGIESRGKREIELAARLTELGSLTHRE